MKIWHTIKRQPALVLALVNAVLGWLVTQTWSTLDGVESASISAVVFALSGFLVGAVSQDAWIGRLTGLVQAALHAGIAFGFDVNQDSQTGLLNIVAAAGMVFIWDRNFPKELPAPDEPVVHAPDATIEPL
jgi:hypothetical protein